MAWQAKVISYDRIKKIECEAKVVMFYTEERDKKYVLQNIGGGAPLLFAQLTSEVVAWRALYCLKNYCDELIMDDHKPRRRKRRGNSMSAPNMMGWKDLPAFGGGQCR